MKVKTLAYIVLCISILSGCGNSRKEIDVLELSDNDQIKIKFVAIAIPPNSIGGGYDFDTVLKVSISNKEWVLADKANRQTIKHTKMLFTSANKYQKYDNFMKTEGWLKKREKTLKQIKKRTSNIELQQWQINSLPRSFVTKSYEWDIYISPDVFTANEYDKIAKLIGDNIGKINNSILSKELKNRIENTIGEKVQTYKTDHPEAQITSIGYFDHNKSVVRLYNEFDKSKILVIYPYGTVCLTNHNEDIWEKFGDNFVLRKFGVISTDGEDIYIFSPKEAPPQLMTPKNSSELLAYLEQYKDKNGENLFHYFEPIFVK